MDRQKTQRKGWGVFALIRTGLILIGLLLLNSFLVKTLVDTSAMFSEDLRISQTLQFVLPLIMIFFEYWIYDFLRRMAFEEREA